METVIISKGIPKIKTPTRVKRSDFVRMGREVKKILEKENELSGKYACGKN